MLQKGPKIIKKIFFLENNLLGLDPRLQPQNPTRFETSVVDLGWGGVPQMLILDDFAPKHNYYLFGAPRYTSLVLRTIETTGGGCRWRGKGDSSVNRPRNRSIPSALF